MVRYVDLDKIVAEIERRTKLVEKRLKKNNSYSEEGNIAWERDKSLYDSYNQILSFLDTLEVKEGVITIDAFIEKACKWLDGAIYDYIDTGSIGDFETLRGVKNEKFLEDFRSYMKGE